MSGNGVFMQEYCANVFVLGLMIYREAAGESDEGKMAVGFTALNRVDHPKWWGDDLYSVITKSMQYSSMTAKGDPMTVVYPALTDKTFLRCLEIAEHVYLRDIPNPVPGCDSYYAAWMDTKGMTPKWADPKKFVTRIGHHKFFNLDGDPGGEPAAQEVDT
jgi:N-acetylmuramoyl-L-alanine amidase